jgi:16S rRNA (guanine527-N7)-methyltransferase
VAERYVELLAGPGVRRGLIGPAEPARIWARHVLNCAAVAELVPDRCWLVDVGSGAGLPGIVLAMMRPAARVTLLEPMARRCAFLTECLAALGLANAVVVRARAEEWGGRPQADVVTARAVAPLARLAGMLLPIVRPGGTVLAIKGDSAEREVAAARPVLDEWGVQELGIVRAGGDKVDPAVRVVRMVAARRDTS